MSNKSSKKTKNPITLTDVARIQSTTDKKGGDPELISRLMRAATKNAKKPSGKK